MQWLCIGSELNLLSAASHHLRAVTSGPHGGTVWCPVLTGFPWAAPATCLWGINGTEWGGGSQYNGMFEAGLRAHACTVRLGTGTTAVAAWGSGTGPRGPWARRCQTKSNHFWPHCIADSAIAPGVLGRVAWLRLRRDSSRGLWHPRVAHLYCFLAQNDMRYEDLSVFGASVLVLVPAYAYAWPFNTTWPIES